MQQDEYLDNHILNIIQNNEIQEQIVLQKLLQDRGYDIPQATLSRRLKKLKIAKIEGVYKIIEFRVSHLPLILNMQVSDFGLIILHTSPGNANNLAYFFDQKYIKIPIDKKSDSPIIGTIAGDDTVLIIIRKQDDIKKVISIILNEFPYLQYSENK